MRDAIIQNPGLWLAAGGGLIGLVFGYIVAVAVAHDPLPFL